MLAVLLLAALVLGAATWLRGAEYDEQYTLFLTAGTPRPVWPETVFPAGTVATLQGRHASLGTIAADLRTTDVHPPFYFWAVSLWRQAVGPSLMAARLLSVLCGLVSLFMVGIIARRCGIRPTRAMLLTLGCYGFVYTNAIARGFAPAEMLTLCGVALLLHRRFLLAGACLGAACCCNYLAVFAAAACVAAAGGWLAALAMLPFLGLDAWFFAAQHASRPDQFPPFSIGQSVLRLTEYQGASVFGGLPLYADGPVRIVLAVLVGLVSLAVIGHLWRARSRFAKGAKRILLAGALAPPAGLLLLGAVFDKTPIELRYLSFGLPFIALLMAAMRAPRLTLCVHAFQAAAILGLLFDPRTMQAARAAATEAARAAEDGIVLIPRGNDGVGIIGSFGIEAPPGMPLLAVGQTDAIIPYMTGYRRAVVVLMPRDRDSIPVIGRLHDVLTLAGWRRAANGSNIALYEKDGKAD
jgi:hypothetical protein